MPSKPQATNEPVYLISETLLKKVEEQLAWSRPTNGIGRHTGHLPVHLKKLVKEIRTRPAPQQETFKCPDCNRTFDNEVHLGIHHYTDHQIAHDTRIRKEGADVERGRVLDEYKTYAECHRCYRDDGSLEWTSVIIPDHLDEFTESLRAQSPKKEGV